MDKKDLEQELENNTQGLDEAENQENESVNNVTSENDIAEENAEESSEWQFDAEAPTISDDVLEGKEFEIDAAELEIPTAETDLEESNNDSDKIVLSKKKIMQIPIYILAGILAVLIVILGVKYFTIPNGKEGALMNPPAVVASVSGEKVSIGMFNYYYSSLVNYYEKYAAYGYYDLDTSVSYDEQFTTDEEGNKITWSQFFKDKALEEIEQITALYHSAKKEGIKLTETQEGNIEDQIEQLKQSASSEGISLNEYIVNSFGDNCTVDTIETMLEQYYITANYRGMLAAQNKIDDEQIDDYFDAHKENYYKINFSYIACEYDTTDENTTAKSKKTVEDIMSKITDRQSIVDLVPVVYKDYIEQDVKNAMSNDSKLTEKQARKEAIATYEQSIEGTITGSDSPFGEEINKWIFDDATKIGSKNYYIDDETGYAYIILKTEMATLDEEEVYSVRHILITPEQKDAENDAETGNPKYSDEAWAEAEKKAKEVLDEYNSGDKSEYSFALLAEKYTTDTASTSSGSSGSFGGLYEGVTKGTMVPNFENWALDDSRKYGDVDIVKSDYGYHIMFFVNKLPKYKSSIITQIRTDNEKEIVDNAKVKIKDKKIDKAVAKYNESKKEEALTSPDGVVKTTAAKSTSDAN